jgi:putative DNA primase/helicase
VGERFVLPGQVIGAPGGVWFNGDNAVQYQTGGKFEDWKTQVAAPCADNSYLMFALSCAFAGPLLEPLNIPGLGFHYYGDSTTGKSTALAIAASAWGPGKPPFMMSWRSTTNGLESQAISRSSTLIPIDESHQADPKVLDNAVYLLLNGTSKARMKKDLTAGEITPWRSAVLSSGERSIETHQTTARIDHKVGQTVRMIDIPVIKSQHGLFGDIHGTENGAKFADALRDAAGIHYGHAGTKFITELIKRYPDLNLPGRLDDALQQFEKTGPLGAQDRRVARCFALTAMAGELAIEWGILPWNKDRALIAAIEIFYHWKQTQPQSTQNKETAQILTGFSEFIETRDADFSNADWTAQTDQHGRVTNAEPVIHERAGYWKEINGLRVYCFNAKGFQRASSGFSRSKVVQVLEDAGAFVDKDPGRKTKKIWIPQLKRSLDFYMVDPDKLELK